jgi:preprotein translocase subunit SecA
MAGRGTDIVLGGNPEFLARDEVGEEESDAYKSALEKYKVQCLREKEEVIAAGGLFIVGTERHESRRIDNQLRGRSGRQGDPGESRFYLSLEDSLMRIFNGERIQKIMTTLNVPDDEPIQAPMVSRAIEGAQRKVEGHHFDVRKHLLEYDDVMNQQRTVVYGLRRQVLGGDKVSELVLEMLSDVTSHILDLFADARVKKEDWDLDGMNTALSQQFGLHIEFPPRHELSADGVTSAVSQAVKAIYDRQKIQLGAYFDQVQKMVLLQAIDGRWKEHLQRIDRVKEGINLRAYAQKDPLIEYKKEAFNAFSEMNHLIKSEAIEKLVKVQLVPNALTDEGVESVAVDDTHHEEAMQAQAQALEALRPREQSHMTLSGAGEYAGSPVMGGTRPSAPVQREAEKIGRNDPCPCGSGKKYKKCHGAQVN